MDLQKAFLVDDEPIVISDLSTLIDWKESGFEIVGWAYSAEQALEQIPQQKPDVVFMDVSLPSMDGLDLSDRLRAVLPDLIVIVLSGYRDFSYAQRAINLGVLTYVVKHELTPEKLREVLQKVKEEHWRKARHASLIRSQIISDLCTRKVEWKDLQLDRKTFLSAYEKKRIFCALMTRFHPAFRPPRGFSLQEIRCLSESARKSGNGILDFVPVEGNLLLTAEIPPPGTGSAGEQEKAFPGTLRSLMERITDAKNRFFAVYSFRECPLEHLDREYRILAEAGKSAVFFGSSQAAAAERLKPERPEKWDFSFLRPAVFSRDSELFFHRLADCFGRIIEARDSGGFADCIAQIRLLTENLPQNGIWEEIVKTEAESARGTADCILEALRNYHLASSGNRGYSAMTNFVIGYIRKHYSRSPTLQDAAGVLNSNSMYVGQKFKKETGKGFHDYLTEYRIRLAQDMLANTNMKIFEISEETGIRNSQYFSRIFKEITGLTPVEYRNRYYQAR